MLWIIHKVKIRNALLRQHFSDILQPSFPLCWTEELWPLRLIWWRHQPLHRERQKNLERTNHSSGSSGLLPQKGGARHPGNNKWCEVNIVIVIDIAIGLNFYCSDVQIFSITLSAWADSISAMSDSHLCVSVCVQSRQPSFQVDRTLLVEEHISIICIPIDCFLSSSFCSYNDFLLLLFLGFFGLCKPAYCA